MAWLKGFYSGGSIHVQKPVTFEQSCIFSSTVTYQTSVVNISNAQLSAIRATPIQLVAAPGTSKWVSLVELWLFLDYTAPAFTESSDNLAVRYTDGSGYVIANAEMTGFITLTADTYMQILPGMNLTAVQQSIPSAAQLVNQKIVLHNSGDGEFGNSGGSTMKAYVAYRTYSLDVS